MRLARDFVARIVPSPMPKPPVATSIEPTQLTGGIPKKPTAVVGIPTITSAIAAASQRLGRRP